MDIVKVSNIFNVLVGVHPVLKSYHFGWGSDINRNVNNNYDADFETGKKYPHVQWVAAPEGEFDLKMLDNELEVDLRFYDLQGRDNNGCEDKRTLIEHWRDLKLCAIQFLRMLMSWKPDSNGGLNGVPCLSIGNGCKVKWYMDSNVHNDRLVCVGIRFILEYSLINDEDDCDIEIDLSSIDNDCPLPIEGWDYEYKECIEDRVK